MILGMATMFFDFYTTPLLTLGLPLLGLLICQSYSKNPPTAKAMLMQSLKLMGIWFVSYFMMWITKLVLTSVFTDQNAFASAWGAARIGSRVKDARSCSAMIKLAAIISAFKHLFTGRCSMRSAGSCSRGIVMILLRTQAGVVCARAVMQLLRLLPITGFCRTQPRTCTRITNTAFWQ